MIEKDEWEYEREREWKKERACRKTQNGESKIFHTKRLHEYFTQKGYMNILHKKVTQKGYLVYYEN